MERVRGNEWTAQRLEPLAPALLAVGLVFAIAAEDALPSVAFKSFLVFLMALNLITVHWLLRTSGR